MKRTARWLLDDSTPRPGVGPRLVRGAEFDAGLYPPAIVEEWVRSGAAEWVSASKKAARAAGDE